MKQVWVSKVIERFKSGQHELLLNDCIDVLWNREAQKVREVILTKVIMDGLSCWVNGYHNVSSVLHIDNFDDWLVRRLLESNVKQVVLALFYNDLKSDQVTKFISKLVSSGFVVLKVRLPRTMTLQRYAMKKDLGDLFDSVVNVQGIVSLSNSATDKSTCKTTHESTCNATSPTLSSSSSPASTSSITKLLKLYIADSKQLNSPKPKKTKRLFKPSQAQKS